MSEPQPEYVWAYSDEKPKRGGVWLIVGLVVLAVAIAAAVFWLFIRPSLSGAVETPRPTTSASDSPVPSPTATSESTPTPTPSSVPSVEPTAPVSPPQPRDPSVATFRDKVSPVLGDAKRGLQIVGESDPQEASQNVGFLQEDAGRLSEVVAPSSISTEWNSRLGDYSRALQTLRAAYDAGASADEEFAAANSALAALNETVG